MKPLDYAILAVIAVWTVLAVRSIWKRRGSSSVAVRAAQRKKKKYCIVKKRKKNQTAAAAARTVRKKRKLPLPLDSGNFDFGRQL